MRVFTAFLILGLAASVADARPHLLRRNRCQQSQCSQSQCSQPSMPAPAVAQYQVSYQASQQVTTTTTTSAVTQIVNQYRASAGLHPLAEDPELTSYASNWSAQMARTGFRHSPSWIRFGGLEVIAKGQRSPADVVRSWMASGGHRDALMSPSVTRFGLGQYGSLWTGITGR